jgi:foldase protein PrsA
MLSFPYLPDIMRMPEPNRSDALKKILDEQLEQLIDREVILQETEAKFKKNPKALEKLRAMAAKEFDKKLRQIRVNAKVKSDDELKDQLRQQGLSLESLRRQTERDYMAKEFMMMRLYPATATINFADVRDYYEAHKEEFQTVDKLEWQYIYISVGGKHATRDDAKRFAEHLRERARNGEDFAKLAANFDEGYSALKKGAGLGNKRGEIRPAELEGPLFGLQEGEIGSVVEAGSGFHVFRVLKREYAGQLPFNDKVQTQIRNQLRNEAAGREYRKIIEELRGGATIEVFNSTGELIPTKAERGR